jgi:DNA-binding XRE family transcriptional regulator
MLDFGFASEQEARFELCQRLRAQRLVQGLSQAELAERAGLSVSTVKLIEAKAQCTLENFMRVIIGLGLAGELHALFVFQPKSIAQMEQAAQASRVRAPRRPRAPPPQIQPQASADTPAPAVKPSP